MTSDLRKQIARAIAEWEASTDWSSKEAEYEYLKIADVALAAIAAAGYKVLAREPTLEMYKTGCSGVEWTEMWDVAP